MIRSASSYGSWYGILRVVVRHTTGRGTAHYEPQPERLFLYHINWKSAAIKIPLFRLFRTQRPRNTEESILSVLIRAIRALKIGWCFRRTHCDASLQPCGMPTGHAMTCPYYYIVRWGWESSSLSSVKTEYQEVIMKFLEFLGHRYHIRRNTKLLHRKRSPSSINRGGILLQSGWHGK